MKRVCEPITLFTLLLGSMLLFSAGCGSGGDKPVKETSSIQNAELADDDDFKISGKGPHPKAVPVEEEYEFGVMEVGETLKHTFEIKNEGAAPLKLKKGPTSCKCTLSELAQNEIPPGESATIELEWHPLKVNDTFQQRATIKTNDPNRKEVKLYIRGKVQQIVMLQPLNRWNLGAISETEVTTVTGHIYSAILEDFNITKLSVPSESITLSQRPFNEEEKNEYEAKSGYTIQVEVDPNVEVGQFDYPVTIQTDIKDGKTFTVNLSGHRNGPLSVIPPPGVTWFEESMGARLPEFSAAEGKKVTFTVYITGLSPTEEMKLENVDAEPDFIKVLLKKDEKHRGKTRQKYVLTFDIPAGSPPQQRLQKNSAKIILHTTHPEMKKIKFFLSFLSV